jgi:hypothetical protein
MVENKKKDCLGAPNQEEAIRGGGLNEKRKLTFTVYFDRRGLVRAIDLDCKNGCSDDCPVKKVCDKITATLFKMVGKDDTTDDDITYLKFNRDKLSDSQRRALRLLEEAGVIQIDDYDDHDGKDTILVSIPRGD